MVGGNLFDFGDEDGHGDDVRLQHPLGIYALGDKLLIADTYNHKIKELDPQTRTVKTLFGTGKRGQADGKAPSFYEPAGLSVANGKLYIADANNHAIRVVDLKTKETSTLHNREHRRQARRDSRQGLRRVQGSGSDRVGILHVVTDTARQFAQWADS